MDTPTYPTRLRMGLVIIITALLPVLSFSQSQQYEPTTTMKSYNTLMQIIKYAYVDTVNESKLVENAIESTLKELDPHSAYISKKDVERANEALVGNFEGIGVQFEILNDTINIVHPIPGGPSDKLGIMSGDKIIKINGEDVAGKKITNQFVFDRLRGKKGTKVTVSILRRGKEPIDYTITRDKIPINSVDAAYMIAPGVGYINLNRFSATSMTEIDEALKNLKSDGMKKLILDLRNNSGGYMNTAIELADEFLSNGELVVYTEGAHSPREEYNATVRGQFETGKLVIMINENSASASEIVAGAVQDWDRGLIVGRRSFGKGLVQRPFMLPDSSQVRLTTARYHTPSGRCIQKPYTGGTEEYEEDLANRMKHGELENPDSIKFPDSLRFYTNSRRIVYGAGGIMPDVFIPWDSTPITDYYMDMRRKNVVGLFVSDYVDKHREELKQKYPDFNSFDKNFVLNEDFMSNVRKQADKEGITYNEKQYFLSEDLIKSQIKSLIAQKLWDLNDSYVIINEYDKEVQKALQVIQDDSMFDKLGIAGKFE